MHPVWLKFQRKYVYDGGSRVVWDDVWIHLTEDGVAVHDDLYRSAYRVGAVSRGESDGTSTTMYVQDWRFVGCFPDVCDAAQGSDRRRW